MINDNFLQKLHKKITKNKKHIFWTTISGVDKQSNGIFLKLRIFEIEKTMRFFAVKKKKFKYDLLIGRNRILQFRLCPDHTLEITQCKEGQDISKQNKNTINRKIRINRNECIHDEESRQKRSTYQKINGIKFTRWLTNIILSLQRMNTILGM